MLVRRLALGSLTLAAAFHTGCSFSCTTVVCEDTLRVTVANAGKAFDFTPTPTVFVCAVGEKCSTFHLTKMDSTIECKVDDSLANGIDGPHCFFDNSNGELTLTAIGGEEDELGVTIEVRAPDGTVAFSAQKTVENTELESCHEQCYDATAAFTIPQ